MTEKGEWIVGEIDMGWGLISPVLVDVETICVHGSLVNVGTIPILESHVDTGTVHTYASMPTEVQTPQKSDSPTVPLWML